MSSKYEKGKLIESLDELVKQPRIYLNDKVYSKGWFLGWGIGWVIKWMEMQQVRYAIRIKEKEKDNG